MTNIVQLPTKPDVIWICGCGCATYELYADDTARCSMCGKVASADNDKGGWFEGDTPDQSQTYDGDAPVRDVHGNGSIEFARRLAARRASSPDAIVNVTIREDGTVHVWCGATTDAQYEWSQRKLDAAKALLARKVESLDEQD